MSDWHEYFEHMEVNRAHWEEAVGIHVRSRYYDVPAFKAGKNSLLPVELVEVGTGGDEGHAPARRSYEKAGYTPLPLVRYYKRL